MTIKYLLHLNFDTMWRKYKSRFSSSAKGSRTACLLAFLCIVAQPAFATRYYIYDASPCGSEWGVYWPSAAYSVGQIVTAPQPSYELTEYSGQVFPVNPDLGNQNSDGVSLARSLGGSKWQIMAYQFGTIAGQKLFFTEFPCAPDNNDGNDNGNCPNSGCQSCRGMPIWSVSEPYISLWLHDEPLEYQPATGPRISFEIAYKQRESVAGFSTNIFSAGKKWDISWLSYVALDNNGNEVVYYRNGGQRTYLTTTPPVDYFTDTQLSGNTNSGFSVLHPDGGQEVYGFILTNSAGAFLKAFLTQMQNARGQKTTLTYYSYNPTNPIIRLQYVIDGDGNTNCIYYATNNAYSTNLISRVVDPFGRTALLAYDSSGHLTNITDVAANSSSILYDSNDWVTNLTTPYGVTSFTITDTAAGQTAPNGRSVLVTQPDGGHELYLDEDDALGVASSYPTNQIPNTAPFANTLDITNLDVRNSFYWGPRQYANLSTTNISAFTTNDFRLARMQHWLISDGATLSMERDPSPDNGGTVEGQKTWYDYAGKTLNNTQGNQVEPLFVARVLPDGTTQFTYSQRNSFGGVTNQISTYSEGN